MQKSEFVPIANKLRLAYPKTAILDQETFELWFECLADCETSWVNKAVVEAIKTHKFCPSIAEVRELYGSFDKRTDMEKLIEREGLQR